MTERLEVRAPGPLLAFLRRRLTTWRVKTLKARLRDRCVRVNGEGVTRHDHPLEVGDRVELGHPTTDAVRPRRAAAFTTLFLDDDLIAIDKPAGLLSVSTERETRRTALALVRDSLSRPGRRARLWPVHRLDRETSGVLLFARSRELREAVQAGWSEARKVYLAVVEGRPEPAAGAIDQPLWEDRNLNVRIGPGPDSKDARTRYRTRESTRFCTLLEVELDTGRRHQIRVHLAWLGHPVVGDARYGQAASRMGLHARSLRITHPRTGRALEFEAPPPSAFSALLHGPRRRT